MASSRVYCGVATAEMPPWLTVAVVDEAGRLVQMRHLSDDPAGYSCLTTDLLVDGPDGWAPVAVDSPQHLMAQLLAAAGRPVAVADPVTASAFADQYADDTSYEGIRAPDSQRLAVGLAYALHAGALYAPPLSPSRDMDEFRPVLAAHGALAVSRRTAAEALGEVLSELFPAALRAFPYPADQMALCILEALPEPGLLIVSPSSRGRESAIVANLAASGLDPAAVGDALSALRMAVEQSARPEPGRPGPAIVAGTVQNAAVAVRACDGAIAALMDGLAQSLAGVAGQTAPYLTAAPYLTPAPVSPALPRRGSAADIPSSRVALGAGAASAAAGMYAPYPAAGGAPAPEGYLPPEYPAERYSRPPVPAFREWSTSAQEERSAPAHEERSVPAFGEWSTPAHEERSAPAFGEWSTSARGERSAPAHEERSAPAHGEPSAPSYATSPQPERPAANGTPGHRSAVPPYTFADASSTTLSFEMDPLNAPLDPPPVRLVPSRGGDQHDDAPARRAEGSASRVIDGERAGPIPAPRAPSDDDDLLIFSTTSAWFTKTDGDEFESGALDFAGLADDGWRAAEQVSRPSVGDATTAGLPRRVPQANLVPGSAHQPDRRLRVARDARSIADHTDGYFRGWRRGQEIGGFAVGQRDRAAWEFNRDQRLHDDADRAARAR